MSILNSFKLKRGLSSIIWENSETNDFQKIKILPEIRKHILSITENFIEFLNIGDVEVEDILLLGSLANYNWSEYSDMDIHIIIDKSKISCDQEITDEFFYSKKTIYNQKHNIKIKGFDVELYIQDITDIPDSLGQYSVLYNKWLLEPSIKSFTLNKHEITRKVKEFYNEWDNIEKTKNLEDRISKLVNLKNKIKKYRKSGLDYGGEFSVENIVFKYLRRSGFLGKISHLKLKSADKLLSLKEFNK